MDTGLIHIYCGDGKGKTTAAVGLTVRCAGRGGRVLFIQFLKERETGELRILSSLPNVEIRRGKGSKKFTFQMSEAELAEAKNARKAYFTAPSRLAFTKSRTFSYSMKSSAPALRSFWMKRKFFHFCKISRLGRKSY